MHVYTSFLSICNFSIDKWCYIHARSTSFSTSDLTCSFSLFADVRSIGDLLAQPSTNYDDREAFTESHGSFRHPSIPLEGGEAPSHQVELQGSGQTFFPNFANLFQARHHQPLGHSRPSFNQEGAYSQRPGSLRQLLNYQAPSYNGFRNNDYAKAIASPTTEIGGILGSGNFEVMSGGTFFSDNSDTESQFSDSYDTSYFNNNGHGRPAFYYGNSNPRPNYNEEQFSNFRDFADISAPTAFSQYVVVYANKNATVDDIKDGKFVKLDSEESHLAPNPKNIIERLAQIDEEQTVLPAEQVPEKKSKVSKGKSKLALYNMKQLTKKKNLKKIKPEFKEEDPLLALS